MKLITPKVFITSFGLILSHCSAIAQLSFNELHYFYSTNGQDGSSIIKMDSTFIITNLKENPNRQCNLMAVFSNQFAKDTLPLFFNEESMVHLDSISCQFMEDDSVLKVCFKVIENDNLGEHGGYLLNKTVVQLWQLSPKIKLFEATISFSYQSDYITWPTDSTMEITNTLCGYKYPIEITSNLINIGVAEVNFIENCEEFKIDHKPGLYIKTGSQFVFKQ